MTEQRFGICEWSLPVSGPLAMRLAAEAGYDLSLIHISEPTRR